MMGRNKKNQVQYIKSVQVAEINVLLVPRSVRNVFIPFKIIQSNGSPHFGHIFAFGLHRFPQKLHFLPISLLGSNILLVLSDIFIGEDLFDLSSLLYILKNLK